MGVGIKKKTANKFILGQKVCCYIWTVRTGGSFGENWEDSISQSIMHASRELWSCIFAPILFSHRLSLMKIKILVLSQCWMKILNLLQFSDNLTENAPIFCVDVYHWILHGGALNHFESQNILCEAMRWPLSINWGESPFRAPLCQQIDWPFFFALCSWPFWPVWSNRVLCVLAALRCLDALHEQLGQSHEAGRAADVHLSSPELCEDGCDPGERHQQAFTSSMALMRRLLEDAQVGGRFFWIV